MDKYERIAIWFAVAFIFYRTEMNFKHLERFVDVIQGLTNNLALIIQAMAGK